MILYTDVNNIVVSLIDFNQNHCASKGQLQNAVLCSLSPLLTAEESM